MLANAAIVVFTLLYGLTLSDDDEDSMMMMMMMMMTAAL